LCRKFIVGGSLLDVGHGQTRLDDEPHNDRTTGSAAFASKPVEFKVKLEIYRIIANRLASLNQSTIT
jgi:hypothetical protein